MLYLNQRKEKKTGYTESSMIRALFFDIDDTLIARKSSRVNDSALQGIIECKKKGLKIIVATGRGYYLMQPDIKERVPYDYMITVNGCCINDYQGKVIKIYPMDADDCEHLISVCLERDYIFGFKFDDSLQVYNHYDEFTSRYCSGGVLKEWIDDNTIDRNYHLTHGLPLGCFVYSPNSEFRLLEPEFPELKFVTAVKAAGSNECFSRNVNKGKTIQYLVDSLGITLDECMAFGDSDNDIEMIRMCGIGVAMGNSAEELKNVADYITTDINDDGIYNALKHFELI